MKQKSNKKCRYCGKEDTHFENKFCSISCADLYDGIITEEEILEMSPSHRALMGYKIWDWSKN